MHEEDVSKKLISISMSFENGYRKYVYLNTLDELIDELVDILVELGDAEFINCFVKNQRNLSSEQLKRLMDAICKTKDGKEIYIFAYCFAKNVKGADITKLEDAVIASKDAEYIFYFATNVNGANIHKLWEAIITTRNSEYISEFKDYFAIE